MSHNNSMMTKNSSCVTSLCEKCDITLFDSLAFDQDRTVNFFIKHGVLKEFTRCENCSEICNLYKGELNFRCNKIVAVKKNKKIPCGFMKSATLNSFIELTELSVEVKFKLISVLLHMKPPRFHLIKQEFGVNHTTLLYFNSYCRQVFVDHLITNSTVLGGPQTVVEITVAKFVPKKSCNWKIKGDWAIGGVEQNSQNCFLVLVETCNANTLVKVIDKWILPGTTVVSGSWKKYNYLSHKGLQELKNANNLLFKEKVSKYCKVMDACWREVRGLKSHKTVQNTQSVGYLAECQFKWKYPKHAERLHYFFCSAAALYPP